MRADTGPRDVVLPVATGALAAAWIVVEAAGSGFGASVVATLVLAGAAALACRRRRVPIGAVVAPTVLLGAAIAATTLLRPSGPVVLLAVVALVAAIAPIAPIVYALTFRPPPDERP